MTVSFALSRLGEEGDFGDSGCVVSAGGVGQTGTQVTPQRRQGRDFDGGVGVSGGGDGEVERGRRAGNVGQNSHTTVSEAPFLFSHPSQVQPCFLGVDSS